MRKYTIFKIGYSAGAYGCNAEYFKVLVFKDNLVLDYVIQAIYTHGQDIYGYLNELGYEAFFTSIPYTQLKRGDIKHWKILRENEVIEDLKNINL
jgi:hypothetical protein